MDIDLTHELTWEENGSVDASHMPNDVESSVFFVCDLGSLCQGSIAKLVSASALVHNRNASPIEPHMGLAGQVLWYKSCILFLTRWVL